MASMEYYSHVPNPNRQKQSQTVVSEAAIEEAHRILVIVKFLEHLCQTDAQALQRLEFSLGLDYLDNSYWLTLLVLLKALSAATSWGFQALQVQDKRAEGLIVTLFRICRHILRALNALLLNEQTS